MPKQPMFDKTAILEIVLSIAPGMITAIFTHNNIWLLASFFSVSSFMPYQRCYFFKSTCIVHLFCSAIISLILSHYISIPQILIPSLVFLGLVLAYIDQHNPELQLGVRWIFISIIYSSFHISNESFTNWQLYNILFLSLIGVILGTAVAPKTINKHKFVWYKNHQAFIFYFKYASPLLIALLILFHYHLQQGEWLVWSSLSVVYLELELSKKRAEDRLKSLAIGVICALALAPLLPHYYLVQFVYLLGIFLSLRVINHYRFSFGLRCFFIMLYANHNFMEVGKHRVINIVLGAIIGCTTSYIIIKLSRLSRHSIN